MPVQVLFDFDLFGDPSLDAHLTDVMLAIKSELLRLLAPLEADIEKEGGIVLVGIKPGKMTFKYHYGLNADTHLSVQRLLKAFDWCAVLQQFTQLVQN